MLSFSILLQFSYNPIILRYLGKMRLPIIIFTNFWYLNAKVSSNLSFHFDFFIKLVLIVLNNCSIVLLSWCWYSSSSSQFWWHYLTDFRVSSKYILIPIFWCYDQYKTLNSGQAQEMWDCLYTLITSTCRCNDKLIWFSGFKDSSQTKFAIDSLWRKLFLPLCLV